MRKKYFDIGTKQIHNIIHTQYDYCHDNKHKISGQMTMRYICYVKSYINATT